tara:strand:+ start:172 stop:444 length:273 start_codon:yes stop_codon:yes gene_type:complete
MTGIAGSLGYKYTHQEYKEFSKNLIGSLVKMAMGEKMYGTGIILKHRRYYGEIHLNIAWFCSPHFAFKRERMFGWHNYERVRIVSITGER